MQVNIMLTGTFGVGKSALFDRLLFDKFENHYQGTVGVRTNQKALHNNETQIDLHFWDIAGEVDQKRVPLSYFQQKDVILYLIDLSRSTSFKNVHKDVEFLQVITQRKTVISMIGTKEDLVNTTQLEDVRKQIAPLLLDLTISAKTGKNISALWNFIETQVNKKLLWKNPKQST